MTWTLRVPIPTPSLNTIQGKHWAIVQATKKNMALAVMCALSSGPKVPVAAGKRRLTIVRHGKGLLDSDNLAGGCKGLIDALKHRGLVIDDDPEHLEVTFHQVLVKSDPHTIVRIEEAA